MLIIGHRGAAGLAPENSLEALQKGIDAGADMLEFDVQLTRDKVLVIIHDSTLFRTHKKRKIVRWMSHTKLEEATTHGHKIATLEEVLDRFFGRIMLNLEIKSRGAGKLAAELIKEKYIKKPSDWQNVLFSSFKGLELMSIRHVSKQAELSMLHYRNPFLFITYQRSLHLTAVGFHRLYVNELALQIAKRLGLFVYTYTVNRPHAAKRLEDRGVDGVVTDNPELLLKEFE